MKRSQPLKIIMSRMIVTPIVFASMYALGAAPKAQARECSNATLQGAYGFHVGAVVMPAPPVPGAILAAGTPRVILGRIVFDGRGSFTNTLTISDGGTVTHGTDFGTYAVNADCTGKVFTNASTRTIEIVIVDGGNEFYQLRTDAPNILFLFNSTAKKQVPGDSQN